MVKKVYNFSNEELTSKPQPDYEIVVINAEMTDEEKDAARADNAALRAKFLFDEVGRILLKIRKSLDLPKWVDGKDGEGNYKYFECFGDMIDILPTPDSIREYNLLKQKCLNFEREATSFTSIGLSKAEAMLALPYILEIRAINRKIAKYQASAEAREASYRDRLNKLNEFKEQIEKHSTPITQILDLNYDDLSPGDKSSIRAYRVRNKSDKKKVRKYVDNFVTKLKLAAVAELKTLRANNVESNFDIEKFSSNFDVGEREDAGS